MNRNRTLIALALAGVLASALFVVGCTPKAQSADDSKALEGHVWKATEIRGAHGANPAVGAEVTAEFKAGTVSGSGGVNRYNAPYTTAPGNKITIGPAAATLMAGPPAEMAQEQAYFAALGKATSYVVSAESLTLQDAESNVLVKYVPVQPVSLTGTEWEAINYNNGRDALVSLAPSSSITAKFGTDGSLGGNASVNEYTTKYTSSGESMTIDPQMAVTRLAGPQDLMDQEAAYLAALPKTTSFTIEGDQLWLRDATGAAMAVYVGK